MNQTYIRRILVIIVLLVGGAYILNIVVPPYLIKAAVNNKLDFTEESLKSALEALQSEQSQLDTSFKTIDPIQPMIEISPFDDDADNWSSRSTLINSGLAIFDANGDDRLDVYLCHDSQNWARPTDENGVLMDTPRYQHNCLYINQGNDINGHPTFLQINELVTQNDRFVKEELLVEDYLYPRTSANDSEDRFGRQSFVAVSADFNGDGRPDLLVGNALPGIPWSHPKTQAILPPFVEPEGREAKRSKQPLSAPGIHLLHNYQPRQNQFDERDSSRGKEFMGANSLYINLGDKDNDGLPEWQDISREAKIEGQRLTTSFAIADIDLDGDLDIFEANAMDPDYWPGGSKYWAGASNQLYINQLAETGILKFEQRAETMGVDGRFARAPTFYKLRKLPLIASAYSLIPPFMKIIPYEPEILTINDQKGEAAEISWASVFQDVNDDGYPDLWVANDFTQMTLYINQKGNGFKKEDHPKSKVRGSWMSFAPADFNGDLEEDLFAVNMGAGIFSLTFVISDPFVLFDPGMADTLLLGHYDPRHMFVDGKNFRKTLANKVRHSTVLPPDAAIPNNLRISEFVKNSAPDFDRSSIDAYDFVWGSVSFDMQNDGLPDLYFLGCLVGRGGGLFRVMGTNPGRLLINATADSGNMRFIDLTAEHQVFNIEELRYDRLKSDGYIYRKAPTKNWSKRDMVYSYDRSVWSEQGLIVQTKTINQDMIQTAENGKTVVAADLNGDGFDDLIVRNQGGYDSRRSTATNLKYRKSDGTEAVLSSHDLSYPELTHFDPGRTRTFINAYHENHWLKVKLIDDTQNSYNRDAIGAKLILNDKYLRINRASQGSHIANKLDSIHFAMGKKTAKALRIIWPDKQRTKSTIELDNLKNGTAIISKINGLVSWIPYEKNMMSAN